MRKTSMRTLLSLFAVSALLMTSCSKKINPLADNLFNAEPSSLELVGAKVPVTINGRIPANWFDKNITVAMTPILKYEGGEARGTTKTYQGEKVAGNGIVINQKEGGAITLNSEFDYSVKMNKSELFIRFDVTKNGKQVVELPDMKVADGVIATAALADARSTNSSFAPDAFQRIIKETHDANILFLIQRTELRADQLNKGSIDAWKEIVKEANENDRKKLDVEVSAYASPDGGFKLNDQLAEKREQNTTTYLKKELKRNNVDAGVNAHYTAQDWQGFKQLVEASGLQDKSLVLSVLSMYNDPVEREKEIKNISAVYSELAETILPMLRRSRLIANVEIIGKTDEELVAAAGKMNSDLSLEEMLYAATLKGVNAELVYQQATKKYPNDYRAWNNLGAVYYGNKQFDKAAPAFAEAKRLSTRAVEANMNLALLDMANGKLDSAEQLLGSASGAKNLNEALGLMYIKQGNYKKAAEAFGDVKTNNAAVAQILTKDYNKAQKTLSAVTATDATTDYLMAVVAARTNNTSGVVSNLKAALAKGVSPMQIANDREFARFATNSAFQGLLN